MKVNELMIGDWIKFPIGNEKVCDLPYVEGKGLCASFSASATLFPVEIDKLEPIPLTPEILEKNGFVRVERGEICTCYRWREKSDKIYGRLVDIHLYKEPIQGVFTLIEIETCSNKGDGLNRFHSCDTDYVHQLQHALRLCGIEKEIVI